MELTVSMPCGRSISEKIKGMRDSVVRPTK
jgi:hypothetical protein